MRASRLVSLLLLLQARGQMTAAELARELEVSERTVHRDVEALSASGVPIYAERGTHGGIRLVDGYRTRLTGMTGDEAEALFLAGIPGPAAELGLGTVVAAAQLKILASLPPELRTRASRLVERFHLDAGEWFRASQPVPHLGALSEAVWDGAPDRHPRTTATAVVVRRELEPLGLVLKAGIWYVVARVTTRSARIASRESSRSSPGARRSSARPSSTWPATGPNPPPRSSATCRAIDVVVRVRPDRLDRLRAAVGNAVVDAAEYLADPDPDGWLRLRVRLDWPDEAARRLLAAGRWVEVLEPADVRAGWPTRPARSPTDTPATSPEPVDRASRDGLRRRCAGASPAGPRGGGSPRAGVAPAGRSWRGQGPSGPPRVAGVATCSIASPYRSRDTCQFLSGMAGRGLISRPTSRSVGTVELAIRSSNRRAASSSLARCSASRVRAASAVASRLVSSKIRQ